MKLGTWYTSRNQKASTVVKVEPRLDQSLPSTIDILKAVVKLNKALDDKDWKTLFNSHSPFHAKLADPTYHTVNSNPPEDYKSAMTDKGSFNKRPLQLQTYGISTKVINTIKDNTYMTKPYMPGDDSRDNQMVPGWSIMTNKNLYHAGGIGDIVEDVHASTHKQDPYIGEVPVTVHKFSNDHIEVNYKDDLREVTTDKAPWSGVNHDPLHARQIGLMDYLTGNYDRHENNILIGKNTKENGYRPLLAIDHDRSFNYQYASITPHGSFKHSAMSMYLGDDAGYSHTDDDTHLAKWWGKNKHNIYDEMNRNLQAIKSEPYRDYIRKNFDDRFKAITDWTENADKHGDPKKGLFNLNSTQDTVPRRLRPSDPIKVAEILQALPKDKIEGMELLSDMYNDALKNNNAFGAFGPHPHATALESAVTTLAKQMTPSEFVKFYSRNEPNEKLKELKTDILMDMKNEPSKYATQLAEALRVNKELPEESKFLHGFWVSHIEKILSEHTSTSLREAQ